MNSTCSYCQGARAENELKCRNCGAPAEPGDRAATDYRSCPSCRRRLLALASPACNHCGRRLPASYIKAREADLKRIVDLGETERQEVLKIKDGLEGKLLSSGRRGKDSGSLLDLVDIRDLFTLFSR